MTKVIIRELLQPANNLWMQLNSTPCHRNLAIGVLDYRMESELGVAERPCFRVTLAGATFGMSSPYEPSAANDQMLRVDLQTGVASTWLYRPGAFVGLVGFDGEGHPIVVVVNSTASELWLLRGPQTADRIYAGPGAYSPLNRLKIDHVLAAAVADANGIWF